jgi:hypothetical protein
MLYSKQVANLLKDTCATQVLFTTAEATPPTMHENIWPVAVSSGSHGIAGGLAPKGSGAQTPGLAAVSPTGR